MIKIAFFDVDGTLLRLGHKELSANTAAALRQLHQNFFQSIHLHDVILRFVVLFLIEIQSE